MDVADCVVKRKSTGSYEKVSIEYNSDGLLDAVYYQNYGNTEGWLDSHNDKYFHKNGMIIEKSSIMVEYLIYLIILETNTNTTQTGKFINLPVRQKYQDGKNGFMVGNYL
ncbi:MAG: hypothetical protein CMF23_02245 [Ignavibacteriae bacterium]|nr:hypothetical protein [Ignavibacteriota bacterium]